MGRGTARCWWSGTTAGAARARRRSRPRSRRRSTTGRAPRPRWRRWRFGWKPARWRPSRLDDARLGPPLPRAYEWVDGSAFLNHVRLVRRARGAEPPTTLETDPLVYQGGSGVLLGPRDDLTLADAEWGLDFESEVA